MSDIRSYGTTNPVHFAYIPLQLDVDYSSESARLSLEEAIVDVFRQIDDGQRDRGLADGEWSFLAHNVVNLGTHLMITVQLVVNTAPTQ